MVEERRSVTGYEEQYDVTRSGRIIIKKITQLSHHPPGIWYNDIYYICAVILCLYFYVLFEVVYFLVSNFLKMLRIIINNLKRYNS